ncbi:UNVERIFIED_CONTAM: hypothetical protein GTU68_042839 [Idotea baltica]|nr:hypothetical protein [Idotea baltica]
MENIRPNSSHIIVDEENSIAGIKCHSLHTSTQSADLAPVHSASKFITKMSETEGKVHNIDSDSHSHSLSTNLQDKLTLTSKSKNCNKNGMSLRLGTTDVEVHYGAPTEASVKALQGKSDFKSNVNEAQLNNFSSQENKTNSYIGFSSNNSKPSASSSYTVTNFKPDSTVTSSSNGIICNGHSVSEATSSNSLAISDFSLSSDKSTSLDSSFSCPGARPRTRNTSNSSSQSTQPQSECEVDLSSTSDSCKLLSLEANLSPVPIPASPSGSIPTEEDLLVQYVNYENEHQMDAIMRLIQKDLSEPYSIYTYRYFIHNWPKLCFLAMIDGDVIGAIVCKLDLHKKVTVRGYIAMLAVDHRYRKRRIGSNLVQRAIREMAADDADEVVLETEITNKPALQLYENLGFVRDKRLFR